MHRRACVGATVAFAVALAATPAFARRPAPKPSPTPTPTAIPTPPPLTSEARIDRLRARIEDISRAAPGRLGVTIVDTSLGTHVAVRGSEAFPLATTYRIAVALTAFRRVDQHRFELSDRTLVTSSGFSITYWELVRAMLVGSDRTASDAVLRAVGGPSAVQGVLDRLGFRGFSMGKSQGGNLDRTATPDAVAALLQGIAEQRLLHEDSTYELLTMLENVRASPSRLRAGLPPHAKLADAAGASATIGGVTDATNDAGVFTLPDGRRIVIVALLNGSSADSATRDATLAQVAAAAYAAFGP
ncbi:MAG: serine hydrolase [Candidatus Eremiobacteraeota bacterium]|nr:serine hydrolase [Candidatus Eremiobacteraeota bacterium]